MKSTVIDEVTEGIRNNLRLEVRAEVREIDNQKARAMNLIVFNLEEAESPSSETRKREDINSFNTICSAIGVEVEEVNSAFRIGNRDPDKTRPLRITLNNRQTRKSILDNARNIRSKAPKQFEQVVIVKDFTPR